MERSCSTTAGARGNGPGGPSATRLDLTPTAAHIPAPNDGDGGPGSLGAQGPQGPLVRPDDVRAGILQAPGDARGWRRARARRAAHARLPAQAPDRGGGAGDAFAA